MIIGHRRTIHYLERLLARETLAHAYLFHGPEGVGKRTIAMALAQALLCSGARQSTLGGCHTCEDCRLVERLAHPDLLFLSSEQPLVPAEARGIGIENVHELERRLALAPWRGGKKVAIIDGAETMSREAQSALLKTLEEPGGRTFCVLIAVSPASLLPTIRSRCVELGFTTVSDEALESLLGGLPADRRSEALLLAGGRAGRIVRFAQDRKALDEAREREVELERILRADLGAQFAFAEENAREPGATEALLSFMIQSAHQELEAAIAPDGSGEKTDANAIRARADFLASLLRKCTLAETTAVNRRLLTDSAFFERSTSAFPL